MSCSPTFGLDPHGFHGAYRFERARHSMSRVSVATRVLPFTSAVMWAAPTRSSRSAVGSSTFPCDEPHPVTIVATRADVTMFHVVRAVIVFLVRWASPNPACCNVINLTPRLGVRSRQTSRPENRSLGAHRQVDRHT